VALLLFCLGCGSQPPPPHEFDAGNDFSFTQNPNGPWRYGFTRAQTLAAAEVELDTFEADVPPIGFWHPADGGPGYYPYIARSLSGSVTTDASNSWAVRAGELAMEGSPSAQYSVVELLAPTDGSYHVTAGFSGIHFRLSSTDVHVWANDTPLFDAQIDGYGGDPDLHPVVGMQPTANYDGTVQLKAGDLLLFAVGVGANQTDTNDTTGLSAHVTSD
jgi:hypothetical protein